MNHKMESTRLKKVNLVDLKEMRRDDPFLALIRVDATEIWTSYICPYTYIRTYQHLQFVFKLTKEVAEKHTQTMNATVDQT